MNRQLKFRAWDKLEKRFIYPDKGYQGHYVLDLNGRFQNLQNGSGGNEYSIHQFIGILDRNMREIYEGDVVRYKFELHEHEWEESFGEVYFHDGCFMFDRSYQFCAIDVNFRLESLEVIGNMYEDYMYDETGKLVKQFKQ